MSNPNTQALSDAGVSIWLDDLSRELLETGKIADLVKERNVVGLTSNPSIFQAALSKGDRYNKDLAALTAAGKDVEEIVFELTTSDVREACDIFLPIYESTKGVDGRASIEVDPRLAHDSDKTIAQAKQLHDAVDRENVLIKIPATKAGLPAITATIAEGISVNVTLIFSLERYRAVMNAYLEGLEKAHAAGKDLSKIHSVASFFVSRVDTEADRRLAEAGNTKLQGKLAIANAKLAYAHYLEAFSGPRWEFLEGKGATKQRCLWASTSTKNPDYRDVIYVEELIGPETVNTMPLETIHAFQDHGEIRGDTVLEGLDEARALIGQLAEAGVDYDEVVTVLEAEGVQKFADAFGQIVESIRAKRSSLAAA